MDDEEYGFRWTKVEILQLIRLVRQHPQLWNAKHDHFNNRFQRELAYDTISYEIGVTNQDIKKKLRHLRMQYKRYEKNMKSNDLKQPVWEYFNAMKFLFEPDSDANEMEDQAGGNETCLMEVNDDSKSRVDNSTLTKQPSTTQTQVPVKHVWSRTKTLKLIEAYKKFPLLYKINSPEYRDKHKKKLAYENIAQRIGTSTEDIKKKMRCLRTMFVFQLKKMRKNKLTRPTWRLFDTLKFLYDKEYYTLDPQYIAGDAEIAVNDRNPLEDTYNSIQYINMEDGSSAPVEQEQLGLSCVNFKERDEFSTFGRTVASELRLTKEHEAIHKLLKQQILKAVEEAKKIIKAPN